MKGIGGVFSSVLKLTTTTLTLEDAI